VLARVPSTRPITAANVVVVVVFGARLTAERSNEVDAELS